MVTHCLNARGFHNRFMWKLFIFVALACFVLTGNAQDARYECFYTNSLYVSNWNNLSSGQRLDAILFTTPAYRNEALNLVLAEANTAARKLKLSEKLPIVKSALTEIYISNPVTEIKGEGVGNVSTESYTYFVTAGNKLSSVVRQNHDEVLRHFVKDYHLPLSDINTNKARDLAVRWMKSLEMDVERLNRDCQFIVEPVMLDDVGDTNHFIPIYHVNWKTKSDDEFKWHTTASVELFLPTQLLLDLTVSDPKYILGKSLVVCNTDYMSNIVRILSAVSAASIGAFAQEHIEQASVLTTNQIPQILDNYGKLIPGRLTFTTLAYQQEAFARVLQEANQVAKDLKLPEKLPIMPTNLVQVFNPEYGFSQLKPKSIGNVHTTNYGYFVSIAHKLSYVEATHQDENTLKWMKQYRWPNSQIDTNFAYQLATQWLAAAHMDVEALNHDCTLHVEPDRFANQDLKGTGKFVPIYDVYWVSAQNKAEGYGDVADVMLLAPTRTLMSLRIEDPKYILRPAIEFTNLAELLAQTNSPVPIKEMSAPPAISPPWLQPPPRQ